MVASKFGSVFALLGGAAWIVAAVLDSSAPETSVPLYRGGLLGLVIALAAAGYAVVAKAPVWLRAVVSVATVLLGYTIWALVADGLGTTPPTLLGGGGAMAVGGLVGLLRRHPAPDPAPRRQVGGHRAAR
jgi:hypothetical protein